MKKIGLIFRKEIMNAVRDRRVLISTVIIPLLVLPLVTMLPMMLIGKKEHEAQERPSSIVVAGLKYPELEKALRATDRFTFVAADSIIRQIRQGRVDAGIEVTDLPQDQHAAKVKVLFDATRTESRAAADKVKLVISDLSRQIVSRLIDTTKVNLNPVQAIPTNVSSDTELAGFFIGILVGMLGVIGLISGAMVMAIDSTAGEKDRKTLEVLLAAPIARNALVLGKYLATVLTAMVSVVLMTTGYGVSFVIGLRSLGGDSGLGSGTLAISAPAVAIILLVMLATAGFIAALEIAVSIFARSYREAQGYLTPLTFLAVIPVVFMQTISSNPNPALFYVPLMNAMLLIRELLMGAIVPDHIARTVLTSLVCAAIALRLAFAMFRRESVLLR
jgi:sodium transport system permease protein